MREDNFIRFVEDIKLHFQTEDKLVNAFPSDEELRSMGNALSLFRAKMYDSCKTILLKYNYSLTPLVDAITGNTYDIIKEQYPIKRGWGTFVYNRNHKKRLFIHVNHPVDDPSADAIAAELFRSSNAEWLFIAGTPRYVNAAKAPSDIGKVKRTIFQRWHELLTDLTHITLSLHAYRTDSYAAPVSGTDVVISNGKTSDDQWGISQLSLAFRDSLKTAGFRCSLAMYDSGYAQLSGGWNIQGTFTNDSVGFGHWLYLELSENIREHPPEYARFIAAANRALEIAGKKISQQVNHAWGLVSPRVVRVDSLHRIMFPPSDAETYRIVSFDSNNKRNDTLDIRMGNWLQLVGNSRTIARITSLDSARGTLADQLSPTRNKSLGRTLAQIVRESPNDLVPKLKRAKEVISDSSLTGDDDGPSQEPLQVHRIPLRPVFASTISNESASDMVPFRWEGIVQGRWTPHIVTFEINNPSQSQYEPFPSYLIPIINSSYRDGRSRFIGIRMTQVLIDEIARLVNRHQVDDREVGLMAEEMRSGEYYLRIFPGNARPQLAGLNP